MSLECFDFSSKVTIPVSHAVIGELEVVHLALEELELSLLVLVLLLYLIQVLHQLSVLPQLLVPVPHQIALLFQLSVQLPLELHVLSLQPLMLIFESGELHLSPIECLCSPPLLEFLLLSNLLELPIPVGGLLQVVVDGCHPLLGVLVLLLPVVGELSHALDFIHVLGTLFLQLPHFVLQVVDVLPDLVPVV